MVRLLLRCLQINQYLQYLIRTVMMNYKTSIKVCNNYTMSVRREAFAKSIRLQQKQQKMKKIRDQNFQQYFAEYHVVNMKEQILSLNLDDCQSKIIKILDFIKQNKTNKQLCAQIEYIEILEPIINLIVKKIHKLGILNRITVVVKLFDLFYDIIFWHGSFIKIFEKQFNQFLYLIYCFPNNHYILEKTSKLIAAFEQRYHRQMKISNDNQASPFLVNPNTLVKYQQVIKVLLKIYLFQGAYQVMDNQQGIWIEKGSKIWFKNATKCLEICFHLIVLHQQRNLIWQIKEVKESIVEGYLTFLNSVLFMQDYQQQTVYSDSESMNENSIQAPNESVYEQNNLYFVSLLLDISLVRQQLLEQYEMKLLQDILNKLLGQIDKYQIINQTAIKIIKILYEQVIFKEEDLEDLAQKYQCLASLIKNIIESDYL